MLSNLPPELPGTCHRKSTPTLHRFGRTLAQGFYVDVHVGHPRRIRKLGWENPGHGPKGLSGILKNSIFVDRAARGPVGSQFLPGNYNFQFQKANLNEIGPQRHRARRWIGKIEWLSTF